MRLTFLGTRGEIDLRSERHAMHAALLVATGGVHVMIDCGRDWRGRVGTIGPDAILITHAHMDHAGGLVADVACPVYATSTTWKGIDATVVDGRVVEPGESVNFGGLSVEAVPVAHSVRAPTVAYRLSAGGACAFYAPDVAEIQDPESVLGGVGVYVGDGASPRRSMVRDAGGVPIGHASIMRQLEWCGSAGVRRAVFTHCGSPIVGGDEDTISDQIAQAGRRIGVGARLAHDGLEIRVLARDRRG